MSDFETKYIASNATAAKAKAWLDSSFISDPDYPGTIITSIYFDTKQMTLLNEKQESDHIKSKFRIRWYEDLKTQKPSEVGFLEFKHKIGENRFKKRIKVPNTFHQLELNPLNFSNTLSELRLFEGAVLEQLQPSYSISYTRYRYIIPKTDIRLCIDYNIKIKKTNISLVGSRLKPKYLSKCVFELKGETGILPASLNVLEKFGFEKNSFSKYEQCFNELIL